MRKLFILLLLALLAAGSTPGHAAEPLKLYAVLEDSGRTSDSVVANNKMKLVADAGFNAIITTVLWGPGVYHPRPRQLEDVESLVAAAKEYDIQVILKVIPDWNPKATNLHMPLRPSDQRQFAQFAAEFLYHLHQLQYVIVGNEVNSEYFWQPQYTPQGVARSPEDYVRLLAVTYDILKKAADYRNIPVTVIGGELASSGSDDPNAKKVGLSPQNFILKMGEALEKSDRTEPIMDVFSIHPYGLSNSEPPNRPHDGGTIGFADYGKLKLALQKAFAETGQPTNVPLFYSEYGVETLIPENKAGFYRGNERVNGVNYGTQADYYREATRFVACRPDVIGEAKFLAIDEPDRGGWQSGVYFADDTPKPSRDLVKEDLVAAKAGTMQCR